MDIRVRIAYQRSVNFSSYHCSYYSYDKETVVKHEVFEGRMNAWFPSSWLLPGCVAVATLLVGEGALYSHRGQRWLCFYCLEVVIVYPCSSNNGH